LGLVKADTDAGPGRLGWGPARQDARHPV